MAQPGLSKAQKEQARQVVRQEMTVSYSGPLPHPGILEQYNRIVPNGAERIFAQFESQSAHRQKIESKVIASNTFCQVLGAASGLILGLLAIGGGLYLVHEGKGLEGFGAFFTALASLVGVYVYGKKSQSAERKGKREVR